MVALLVFSITAAAIAVRARELARRAEARAHLRAEALEDEQQRLRSILIAEPQVLVHWDADETPRIKARTLVSDLGVPEDVQKLLCFDAWLERGSAGEVEACLGTLREMGHGFNLMSKTQAGGYVEIDGRAAGGGSVLKIRDLAGRREQLARVCEQHKQLGNEIAAFRALLDAFPAPVWFRDANGKIEWVNRTYTRVVEAANPEQVLRDQIELLHSRSRSAAESRLRESEVYRGRARATVAGVDRAFDTVILPIGASSAGFAMDAPGEDGNDGDPVRNAEAYAKALDRIGTGVALFTSDQRLTYFNEAYRGLFELDRDWLETQPKHGEILDRLRADRVLPEEADYREWKEKQLAGQDNGAMPADRWHLPDGRSIHVAADRSSEYGATFFYEDVTERLQLESRYNSLTHVQKETLDKLREGVAVFGTDGRLKLFNPAFARIWKLNGRELEAGPHIDQVIARCRMLLDDDLAWTEVKKAVTSIDDERRSLEGQLTRPDGSVLAYAGLPLPDGAMLLTYMDITDSKRVERALVERAQALETADQLKNTFISHISYELRVPLTNIIGFAELLWADVTGELNEKQREYVADIRGSSDTLLAIINDILDLATIDAGGLDLKLAPVDVREVIDAAVLGVRERLQRAELNLEVGISKDLNELIADEKRVTQILYNLLSNAAGFSGKGGTIRVVCRNDGDSIALSVSDEGIGIREEDQEAVFGRFVSQTHGSNHRGAGLGLTIVKSLVELHDGGIALDSTPGKGTTVTVRLPRHRIGMPRGDEAVSPNAHPGESGKEQGERPRPSRGDDVSPAAA